MKSGAETCESAARLCRRTFGRRLVSLLLLLSALTALPPRAQGLSLALDSIAGWGRFPRFCVSTYRWGDKFFNSYDSTYVQGSGKRWNVKTRIDSWFDVYTFRFDNGYRMDMLSDPSTTAGFYLTYMAVSVGYDMNIGKYFNGGRRARKRFNFQFNCSLFAFDYYSTTNDIGTTIRRMGSPGEVEHTSLDFSGLNTSLWGVDIYYFFNHRHYSQAAAFAYSKIQQRSSGSLYAGLSFWGQKYDFDFTDLYAELYPDLPQSWDRTYRVKNKNYAVRVGYAYNWVFHRGWCVGISVSPTMGLRRGYINNPDDVKDSFAMSNLLRGSLVYNYKKKWFFGVVGRWDLGLIYDKEHTLMSGNLSIEASAGFRFDLWR